MATLQIRKETSKVWRHVPSDELPYIVSKLYIKSDGDNIRVVELGGSQRGIYNFANVTVYDIGGGAESFTSASELMQRLEALGYIGFFNEGEVSPSTLISADLGNIIELGSDGKLYAIGGGGGGSQDLQSVTDLGSTTTNSILITDNLGNDLNLGNNGLFLNSINNLIEIFPTGIGITNNADTKAISLNLTDGVGIETNGNGNILFLKSDNLTIGTTLQVADGNGTIATREWANENKLDKVTTAGVERVYTINADGSQGTKSTSELGGKRTMYLFFPINQNVAASNSWYTLPSAGQILTGTGYTANASLTDANDFADQPVQTPRVHVPFQHKVKSVSIHGRTNSSGVTVNFAVQKAFENELTNTNLTVDNPLIVAQQSFLLTSNPTGVNGFQYVFSSGNLDTSTQPAFSDYRLYFNNGNVASNLLNCMLIVEVEEVL